MNKKSGILWLSWLYIKLHADVLFFFFLKLELTWNSVCYYTSGFIWFCIIYLFVCLLETQGFTMKPRLAWTHRDQPGLTEISLPLLGLMVSHTTCSTGCLHFKPWYHVEFLPCFDFLMQWLPGGNKNRSLGSLSSYFSCSSTPSVCSFVEAGCPAVQWVPDPPATTQVPGLGDYTVLPQGLRDSALS